jgi:hypothetical protein
LNIEESMKASKASKARDAMACHLMIRDFGTGALNCGHARAATALAGKRLT